MVVRVCERARASGAQPVCVATDDERIARAVREHGFDARMTRADHASGTDRIAEAAMQLGLADEAIVVNVQGDEPLIAPQLIARVAAALQRNPQASVATACHPIHDAAEFANPNVVKVVLDASGDALYFSRAGDSLSAARRGAGAAPRRHLRLPRRLPARYASLAPVAARSAPSSSSSCACCGTATASRRVIEEEAIPPGVDTPADLQAVLKLLQ